MIPCTVYFLVTNKDNQASIEELRAKNEKLLYDYGTILNEKLFSFVWKSETLQLRQYRVHWQIKPAGGKFSTASFITNSNISNDCGHYPPMSE